MSKFIQEVNGFDIVRKFEYTQFDTGYAVIDKDGEQVAWFDDVEGDEEGQNTALADAIEWCKS